jgi:UDP-N-acetyl-D-mannosaminuronate dehydrogenase
LGARHLNEKFPEKAIDFIAEQGVNSKTKVLVCGAAFKGRPVTSDTRGSFVFEIVKGLINLGVNRNNITILDPKVDEIIHDIQVINHLDKVTLKFDFMVQLTNHEMFETITFDQFIYEHCRQIISFWPKNKLLNNILAKHLFLGGLQSNN